MVSETHALFSDYVVSRNSDVVEMDNSCVGASHAQLQQSYDLRRVQTSPNQLQIYSWAVCHCEKLEKFPIICNHLLHLLSVFRTGLYIGISP